MKDNLKKVLLKLPLVKVYHFTSNVHAELKGMKEVLELGCGVHSYLGTMEEKPYSVGIDIYEPSALEAKDKGVYDEVRIMNVMGIEKDFADKSFDCVMAMDLIEHLSKEDGIRLLMSMEKVARRKIIIYTPNGYLEQGEEYGNPWQRHLSGWSATEMRGAGYRVTGWGGLKVLRPQFTITRRPVIFWRVIQALSQIYAKHDPKRAFQILCVKDLVQ